MLGGLVGLDGFERHKFLAAVIDKGRLAVIVKQVAHLQAFHLFLLRQYLLLMMWNIQ
jgi:hypothetical protein